MPSIHQGRVSFDEDERKVLQPFLDELQGKKATPAGSNAEGDNATPAGESSEPRGLGALAKLGAAALTQFLDAATLADIPDLEKVSLMS